MLFRIDRTGGYRARAGNAALEDSRSADIISLRTSRREETNEGKAVLIRPLRPLRPRPMTRTREKQAGKQ